MISTQRYKRSSTLHPLPDEGVVEGTLVYSLTELVARFSKNPIIFYN